MRRREPNWNPIWWGTLVSKHPKWERKDKNVKYLNSNTQETGEEEEGREVDTEANKTPKIFLPPLPHLPTPPVIFESNNPIYKE